MNEDDRKFKMHDRMMTGQDEWEVGYKTWVHLLHENFYPKMRFIFLIVIVEFVFGQIDQGGSGEGPNGQLIFFEKMYNISLKTTT